MHTSQGAFIDN